MRRALAGDIVNAPRAVFFLAVSTEQQAGEDRESLPEQRRQLDDAAARFGWRVVDVITVPGFSRNWYNVPEFAEAAADAGMPDALRLFDHWRARDFDVLAALNTTRLGREQSILAEMIRRTIDAGAQVYTVKDGFIDAQSQRMHIAMQGYASAVEVDEFKRRYWFGINGRVKRGLPSAGIPATHVLVSAKPPVVAVDESKRRLFDDIADLVVNHRLGMRRIPAALAERGHPRLQDDAVERWLRNTYSWGHTSLRAEAARRRRDWAWVFDPSVPVPPGVVIYRDTHTPIWTGEQGELLKAELRRRIDQRMGNALNGARLYTGLCLCGVCGRTMSYDGQNYATISGDVTRYLRCISWTDNSCRARARESDLAADLAHLLAEARTLGLAALQAADTQNAEAQRAAKRAALERDLAAAELRARQLIQKQASAPAALLSLYDDELTAIGAQITALQLELARTPVVRENGAQARILAELRSHPAEWFWQQPPATQNRLLAGLLGRQRLVVYNRRIVAVCEPGATPG